MKIKFLKKREDVIMPKRAHGNDAGIDCYAIEDITLPPMSKGILNATGTEVLTSAVKTPLGFGLEIPDGYMVVLKPRSSMNAKGIITQIGTIDSGYRGEILAVLCNLNPFPININKGDRICQLVVEPVIIADFVEDIEDDRGDGGFGSTGK